MIGAPSIIALSITLQIFSACDSLKLPPKTVKSCEKTKTVRPLIVPRPVTTPSPGGLSFSMPKSLQRCVLSMSYSRKLPSSSSSERRSRAVSLPFLCCASTRAAPPPRRAAASCSAMRSRTASVFRRCDGSGAMLDVESVRPSSRGDRRMASIRSTARGRRPAPAPSDLLRHVYACSHARQETMGFGPARSPKCVVEVS